MIFQHTLPAVLNGTKAQTRRAVRPGDHLGVDDEGMAALTRVTSRSFRYVQWRAGQTYAVQPARGAQQQARIRITRITGPEDVTAITAADVQAEGFASREDFLAVWRAMHGENTQAWVIEFELMRTP